MATQIVSSRSNTQEPPGFTVLNGFLDAFEHVQKQLRDGILQPALPLTKVAILGSDGIFMLKKHLQ